MPSPFRSRTAAPEGSKPAASRSWKRGDHSPPATWPTRTDRSFEPLVGHDQVGDAVAVQVRGGDVDRDGPDEEKPGMAEPAAAEARIDQDVISLRVGDGQVGDAVAVEVDQGGAPGRGRPPRAARRDRPRGPERDRGESGRARAGLEELRPGRPGRDHEVARQVALVRDAEDAPPFLHEHLHVAEAVADEQGGPAADGDEGQAGRVGPDGVGLGADKSALPVGEFDRHALRPEHRQVGDAVAVEVGGHDRSRRVRSCGCPSGWRRSPPPARRGSRTPPSPG